MNLLHPYELKDYWLLFQAARCRRHSESAYRRFQSLQADLLIRYLATWGIDVRGILILDLGSGIGGYTWAMSERGANVISLDLVSPSANKGQNILADATRIPLLANQIDLVFCASLIEHVAAPHYLLQEIERILRPGGYCYLSFPPYYSPMGGHEFSPWHYLGERWALRLSSGRQAVPAWIQALYKPIDNPTSFADLYPDWGLYRMTIRKARQLIGQSDLQTIDISTRYLPTSPIQWPWVNELLTWHAQFLLKKPIQPLGQVL